MTQVLDTLAYAERELLDAHPEFARARVLVHLSSNVQVGGCGRHLRPIIYPFCRASTPNLPILPRSKFLVYVCFFTCA